MTEAIPRRAQRLIQAIDVLLTEEEICFQSGGVGLGAIQKRSTPLVDELVRLTEDPSLGGLKDPILALLRRRQALTARLEARMAELRARMHQLAESQVNLRRMAPLYKVSPGPQRLAAAV